MTLEKIKLEDFKGGEHPFQSRYWAEVKRGMHWWSQVFSVKDESSSFQFLLLLRPFLKGRFILAYVPFAFEPNFFNKPGKLKQLSEELCKLLPNKVVSIRYDLPFNYLDNEFSFENYKNFAQNEGLNILKESVQPEGTVMIDLSSGYDSVSKLYRTRAVRILKKNKDKVDVTIYDGDESEFFDWYGIYRKTAEADGFTPREKNYLRGLLSLNKDDGCDCKLYIAWVQGNIRGGIMVLSNKKYGVYLFGASIKSSDYNVSYPLQDFAIKKGIEEGKNYYDFYGINGLEERETHLLALRQFKKSFGGKVLYRVPTCDYVIKKHAWFYYSKLEFLRFLFSRFHK